MRPSPEQKIADVAIIGAGAAGLMAAVSAVEAGLRPVLLDRKHKPGRKLLMCGNARCNLTNMLPAKEFLDELGHPVAAFARRAIEQFPPAALRQWFQQNGLATIEKRGGRVFPASERASDVLNLFQDLLRKHAVPLLLNSPVQRLTREKGCFTLETPAYALSARRVVLCTGGVTYPKTGSVGDGQRLAAAQGLRVTPYRPGLVGLESRAPWLTPNAGTKFEDCRGVATLANGGSISLWGDLELQRWGVCGGLVSNATRCAARANTTVASLEVDLFPGMNATDLSRLLTGGSTLHQALKRHFRDVPPRLWYAILPDNGSIGQSTKRLHAWSIPISGTRPLKEAMVTVGGIALDEITPDTMQAHNCPGLYLAGEILDIDGPTGGFNLQLAFSTARLAIAAMSPTGKLPLPSPRPTRNRRGPARKADTRNKGRRGPRGDRQQANRYSHRKERRRKTP